MSENNKEYIDDIVAAAVKSAVQAVSENKKVVANTHDLAAARDQKRAEAYLRFNNKMMQEDLVDIEISTTFREYLGPAITASVNGNTIKVPVDGKRYKVTKAHYKVIRERLKHIETTIERNREHQDARFGNFVGDLHKVGA